MQKIDDVFQVTRARSDLYEEYEYGDVAYVGNGFQDNAVVGFVTPLPNDIIFRKLAITVSAFCEATVHTPPFVACGRAGNGLVVLEPKEPMTIGQLAYVAAYINAAVRWRFNWYRQTTATRLKTLLIPSLSQLPVDADFPVRQVLPRQAAGGAFRWRGKLSLVPLESLYELSSGTYHSLENLPPGGVPVVSCGDANNGIAGYFDVPAKDTYTKRLTISFNGMNTLTAKYHPYIFGTKDDVAICESRRPLRLTTQLFIQVMLNRERWRYSYYRKCFMNKLRRFEVPLPIQADGSLDEDSMAAVVEAAPYWKWLKARLYFDTET